MWGILAIWLNQLLVELQPQKEPSKLVTIFEDNQSAICMLKNSISWTKQTYRHQIPFQQRRNKERNNRYTILQN